MIKIDTSIFVPVVKRDQEKLYKYFDNYMHVKDKVKLCDPSKVQKFNEEALKALGLNDFVHLDLLPSKDQNKNEIEEFISFYLKGRMVLRHNTIDVKHLFQSILKLPSIVPAEVPANVPPAILSVLVSY
jgi:hypothetical protein